MKSRTCFVCQTCGAQESKWLGRCPGCDAWNSFVEERVGPAPSDDEARLGLTSTEGARLYADVEMAQMDRLSLGINELDRVLGGGAVPGSLVLL